MLSFSDFEGQTPDRTLTREGLKLLGFNMTDSMLQVHMVLPGGNKPTDSGMSVTCHAWDKMAAGDPDTWFSFADEALDAVDTPEEQIEIIKFAAHRTDLFFEPVELLIANGMMQNRFPYLEAAGVVGTLTRAMPVPAGGSANRKTYLRFFAFASGRISAIEHTTNWSGAVTSYMMFGDGDRMADLRDGLDIFYIGRPDAVEVVAGDPDVLEWLKSQGVKEDVVDRFLFTCQAVR